MFYELLTIGELNPPHKITFLGVTAYDQVSPGSMERSQKKVWTKMREESVRKKAIRCKNINQCRNNSVGNP